MRYLRADWLYSKSPTKRTKKRTQVIGHPGLGMRLWSSAVPALTGCGSGFSTNTIMKFAENTSP
jgi:hypothetical protein